MNKKLSNHYYSFFIPISLVFLLISFSGCKTSQKKTEALEVYEKKKANYEALYEALTDQTIKKKTTTKEIRELYGEPDDVYSSGGSTSGRLEIWTYGKAIYSDKIDIWRPVRLYFNNNELIDWTF